MIYSIKKLALRAARAERSTKLLFRKLSKNPPGDLDYVIRNLHEVTFRKTDCLLCAGCCRNLGPRLTGKDVDRLSKSLKLKPSVFTTKYLKTDEDGDYIFKEMPCHFLADDNTCRVYEERPKACREYPHTDRKKFYQLLDITLKNSFICPAVYDIVERLKIHYLRK